MPVSLKKVYENFLLALEKWLVFLTVGGFIGGVLLGRASPAFTDWVNESVESFVDGYGYVAPVAIFLIMCFKIYTYNLRNKGHLDNYLD